MTTFPRLAEPLALGPRTAANRIMRLGTVTNLADGGRVGERMIAHYQAVARGGAAILVTEALRVHESNVGEGVPVFLRETIPGFTRLASAVHQTDALLIGQLNHGGRQHHAHELPTLWGPSAIACPFSGGVPHEMTGREIEDVVEGFVRGAMNLREAGFDGVEIHGAQGHLIQEFVSPMSNQRRDQWGGSVENRLRFPRTILRRVREATGRDFVVGYRMGVSEFVPGGLTLDDSIEIARGFAGEGLFDYLSLSQGNFASIEQHLPDRHHGPLPFVADHARVKAAVGALPTVTCGRIETPERAEKILEAGQADLIGLCRPLVADPEWTRKALDGRAEDLRLCIACNHCWARVTNGRRIACVVNPTAGREVEWGTTSRVEASRHVVVAGGGPAGLEAARVAAERGHRVTILVRSDDLGGKMRLAADVPYHGELARPIEFLTRAIARLGVTARTGVDATVPAILAERPDAVIVATGAVPVAPTVSGDDSVPVSSSAGAPVVGMFPGQNVVVMDEDGYYWAAAVVETILLQKKRVVLATRFFEPLRELPAVTMITTLRAFDEHGVDVRAHTEVARIDQGEVVLRDSLSGREDRVPDVAAVIWVGPQEAQGGLAEELRAAGVTDVRVIGDAFAPRRLANAIEEGHRAGRTV
jgi:2,4-dienoyl-CoA reductase-like NADH-dependent reductase (Old Yellow Enzyme family)/NAD(P)-dependent dehydrogenase (short-subunit alcohol dehydrogenase family)